MQSLACGGLNAPAKVNLALHVVGRRADGYHELESLVVFQPRAADRLDIAIAPPGSADSLSVGGPFAAGVPTGRENIVLRAIALARDLAERDGETIPPLSVRLEKHLPHGAGIGGGSADAGAILRHLTAACPRLGDRLTEASASLGADVPVCLFGAPAIMSGIGEKLEAVGSLPGFGLLLVNPGKPVATPSVFQALENRDNPPLPALPAGGFGDFPAFCAWLAKTRNDLQAPAARIEPSIGEAMRAVEATGAVLTRMSGSGATVFGLFETQAEAEVAAIAVAAAHPDWWVSPQTSER
ncbi:4-diphosphocytidyl-2-C-methyl-D-erythritol kinase [Fulvimarina manganoxydans]|uniref:4-diphosphocytidyl-2-C-methyl-D-erythritol kinase n=1 Tax=Fulvimarina manganoxydans TaxID=937218 RepID=A0A1W2DE96_9HYPH|nr:4-(cytidine 5'-diphospho)-2-C-methyl-D-erythritol kinase [Fulvimarina manganoxydans]SMC95564.1 4-diphosphocytidyl-2-C-methyl-D-erythritol kinase [Fulvimarina manganoxydans]